MNNVSITYEKLKNLGVRLLGPIYSEYYFWAENHIRQTRPQAVLFLSREGFHLKRIFDENKSEIVTSKYIYLETSRALLYKLSLLRKDLWWVALEKSFRGSFGELLEKRFALSKSQILEVPGRLLNVEIELPKHKDIVNTLLTQAVPLVEESINKSFLDYKSYLNSLEFDFNKEITIMDIGFSGTTQFLLARLFNLKTRGLYLYKTTNFLTFDESQAYAYGEACWNESAEFGKGDVLVDWSLVQEAIFTSPEGQLRDLHQNSNGVFEFIRGEKLDVQKYFHITYPIVDGILDLIARMKLSKLNSVTHCIDARRLYEITLRFDRSFEMRSLIEILEVDDNISGFGNIRPFKFLPGLA